MEYLAVRVGDDSSIESWAVFDGDGRIVRRAESGAAGAAEAARGRRVLVLVPGVEVVSTTTNLPNASSARLRKMLPYSLEDSLAEDIDDLVFAVGPRLESGALSVAVVSRTRLETWLAALAAEGIAPHGVYSDAEGVPDTPSTLTLVIEGDRAYGRVPGQSPFVLEGMPLDDLVDTVTAADEGAEIRHAVIYVDGPAEEHRAEELHDIGARIASVDIKRMTDGALYRLAATLAVRPGTNLLQGPYAPKSNWASLLQPWRVAASLLVGFLLLSLIAQFAEYLALRQEDRALTEALTANCEQNFSARQLSSCETAVRGRLNQSGLQSGAGNDFLATLSAVAESRGPSSRIDALSYRNDVMDLQLVVPDIPALDAFAQQMESGARFDVIIQSANPGDAGVEGRVQVIGATR